MERRLSVCAAVVVMSLSLTASSAIGDDLSDRLSLGGYLRLQGLTDFQGGNGRLGLPSNGCGTGGPCLYGRLLNEGPDGIFLLRLQLLPLDKTGKEPWAAMYARVEGESFLGGNYTYQQVIPVDVGKDKLTGPERRKSLRESSDPVQCPEPLV